MSRDRIRKLLGMTTANGCTEAEALAAAAKAAKLMEEMGLRQGDIEMDQDDIGVSTGWNSVRANLWQVIAYCTNTATILRSINGRLAVTYVGSEPGPEVATYLHLVTDRALDRELKAFRAGTWYKRRRTLRAKRAATASFTEGMVVRISNRLFDLFSASASDEAIEAARAERDARFPGSCTAVVRANPPSRYWEARLKGHSAGDEVALSHGVGGGTGAQLQLGGAA